MVTDGNGTYHDEHCVIYSFVHCGIPETNVYQLYFNLKLKKKGHEPDLTYDVSKSYLRDIILYRKSYLDQETASLSTIMPIYLAPICFRSLVYISINLNIFTINNPEK